MSRPGLQSHASPRRLFLRAHIAQIRAAARAIMRQSAGAPWTRAWAGELVPLLAQLHDLGKASAAFQQYIADPDAWRGSSIAKAHSPLSLVFTAHYAAARGWNDLQTLAAALAVRGHHGAQVSDGAALSRGLIEDAAHAALRTQIASVDHALLCAETRLDLPPWRDADSLIDDARDALDDHLDAFRRRPVADAGRARFLARAAYAVLLEADKAFLAVARPSARAYLSRPRRALPESRLDAFCRGLPPTPMDAVRAEAARLAREGFARRGDAGLLTLTLPTGAGKTLIAARWALGERQSGDHPRGDAPTVIVALPMLSIVDQTERVWRLALAEGGAALPAGDSVMASHSLSERAHDTEPDRGTADFFLDTWRAEVVITTFDQLLMAMYSDRTRHAMRYHRLLNARIVIDEVQCVPPALWAALSSGFGALAALGDTKVLAMSATQPRCIEGAVEVLDDPRALYQQLDRYRITLDLDRPTTLEDLAVRTVETCVRASALGERTLATVNTRASAQELWSAVEGSLRARDLRAPALLSGDLTPSHRLRVIDDVREGRVAVVVSTQCVEAGVDIDVDHVLRDLCPFDALVQIAGRCNRNNRRASHGTVTVVDVTNPAGAHESAQIYDEVLLYCTKDLLRGRASLDERDVYDLCEQWFVRVAASKNLGLAEFERWARLRAPIDLQRLLRGDERGQESVVVIEQAPHLERAWLGALRVQDPWARKSELRKLAPEIAAVSVSVPAWRMDRLRCREVGGLSLLGAGQYHPQRGLIAERRPS